MLHYAESLLEDYPGITFLRADYFAENLAGMVPVAQAEGVFPVFHPVDLSYNMVATSDIGLKAVSLLVNGGPKIAQLTGPKRSAQDLAAALLTAFGSSVNAVQVPLEQLVPTFTSFGIGKSLAGLYLELEQAIAAQSLAFENQYEIEVAHTTAESVLTAGL